MRAAIVNETHLFDLAEVDDPEPGPDELVIEVAACGICGSDLNAVNSMPPGLVMGHEFAGAVVACGEGATHREGDIVAALPLIGCGHCQHCENGLVAHCTQAALLGVGGGPGAYAEFVRVSDREAHLLPDGMDPAMGALTEPLAVGLHAVERAGITPGDSVLIFGAGPVGLAASLWARHLGARHVIVADPVEARREFALTFGATGAADPTSATFTEDVSDLAGGPPNIVLECVGKPGLVQASIDACAPLGTVVIVGVCIQPDPFVPITGVMKELSMHFVIYYRRKDFAYTLDMIGQGRIDPSPMVTERIDLEGVSDAFERLRAPTTERKILILP